MQLRIVATTRMAANCAVWTPAHRYMDVALGLLGADEAAELILQTVCIAFPIIFHRCPLFGLLFQFNANPNIGTDTDINC